MYDVVALGELLIDFTTKGVDEGGYPTMSANPGGAPGNFLAALNAYGVKTAFIGKVGNDAFGHLLIKTLSQAGIHTHGIVMDDSFFTTLAFVTLDKTGNRSFSFARKPGADTQLRPAETDRNLIQNCKVLHFGSLSLTHEPARSATQQAVALGKSLDKIISFDPNLRKPLWDDENLAREQILWGLNQAHVVKISHEEVDFLWNCNAETGADILLNKHNVHLAMITLGENGALLKTKNARCLLSAFDVKVVDTTGAGDIFGGSAMARLLELNKDLSVLSNGDLEYIGRYASAAAGISTEKPGGIPSVPKKETVEKRMNLIALN